MQITVSIVEDNATVSASLERVINNSDSCRCVSLSPNAEHALRVIPKHKPDVVVMDIELPQVSGIECTARLKRLLPEARILILTVYKDHDQIFKALKAGANGYILKRSSSKEILHAIRDVKEGGAPMSAEIAAKVVQSFHKSAAAASEIDSLTRREEEILSFLAQGYVSKEIADRLGISYETVRGHLGNIYEKLHVRSRTEAVIKYFQKPA
ncbi:MAG TPA: response regulator transcription factor [Opitutaceae bacterium]|nr:response regulator transcription factor [Opitutaceae bacterium]